MSNLDQAHQDRLVQWLSSHTVTLQEGASAYLYAMQMLDSSHVRMRPALYMDGDQWCALYGTDIQSGVAGFGASPELACTAFDEAWGAKIKQPAGAG